MKVIAIPKEVDPVFYHLDQNSPEKGFEILQIEPNFFIPQSSIFQGCNRKPANLTSLGFRKNKSKLLTENEFIKKKMSHKGWIFQVEAMGDLNDSETEAKKYLLNKNSQVNSEPTLLDKFNSMRKNKVIEIYDEDYAQEYNQKFLLNEASKKNTDFEEETISKLLGQIGEGATWLDVACGTGYFLSRFPNIKRAGLDVSPAMLRVAKQENPNASLVQGDYRDERPQWEGKWDLVTCMWWAYGYVESLLQLETVVENLVSWTSDQGVCFLPICVPEEIGAGNVKLPYSQSVAVYGGEICFEAVIWSWLDGSNKLHRNMIAPQPEYLIALFEKYFDQVETIESPLFQAGKTIAIIARSKKQREGLKTTVKTEISTAGRFLASFFKAIRSHDWWLYKIPPLLAIAYAEILLLDFPVLQSILTVAALLFTIACVAAYGHIINDSFDIGADQQVGKHNSMARFSPWQRALFCLAFTGLGFSLPVLLHFGILPIILLGINYLLPTLYSTPPFRFKEKGILGIISDAAGAHAIPTLFIATTFTHLVTAPSLQATALTISATTWAFFAGLRGILLHQLWDRSDDLKSSVITFVTKSRVETVRFWMSRLLFPVEMLLMGALILVIAPAAPLILVFTVFYFLLKLILTKLDPTATLDPAPVQKAYVIPHDFYEVSLPLTLATILGLKNPYFTILLLLHTFLFYPGFERRITNLIQFIRKPPAQSPLNLPRPGSAPINDSPQSTQNRSITHVQALTENVSVPASDSSLCTNSETSSIPVQSQSEQIPSKTQLIPSQLEQFQDYLQQSHDQLRQLQSNSARDRHHTQTELANLQSALTQIQSELANLRAELAQAEAVRQAAQTETTQLTAFLHTPGSSVVIDYYRHAIATDPDNLQLYDQALALYPHDAQLHLQLAAYLVQQGKLDEAISCCQTAIQHCPNHFDLHLELAKTLETAKRWEEAIATYRCAIELNPHDAYVHQLLGNALAAHGQLNEASVAYRRSLQFQS
ncbi:tetratricopeptide repeat protein [Nodosilinea sp. E11]|uniref:tetratricopeptide repeat protein n=1 Tax=Nodosilinea sp. E11 TaxID=3037479 RepID=UPI002934A9F0|nr:tetratricopeptide repeat protein [Nodosilinea sp. E11]WOD36904.1 tetratricopeptide repeat protein [Nodosilinea sp. E11]